MSLCPDRALTILNSRHTEATNTVRNLNRNISQSLVQLHKAE
jgi:hypothetical protein